MLSIDFLGFIDMFNKFLLKNYGGYQNITPKYAILAHMDYFELIERQWEPEEDLYLLHLPKNKGFPL